MNGRTRGCVFFNFGATYALRLLIAVFSLRRFYNGPITVFLVSDSTGPALASDLAQFGCDVTFIDSASKSNVKHRMFEMSPYSTTLIFDSDLLFMAPIDELWEPLERNGVLATRFFPNPYGVDGAPGRPGWANRLQFLAGIRGLVDEQTYKVGINRLVNDRIDVNVGVMGIASPAGDAFLADWAERMERGRSQQILLIDEMLAFALLANHQHFLANEIWNCPADEFFRRTNLADARIIHYFADGCRVHGIRLGRNRDTWAGKKWYAVYRQVARQIDLRHWTQCDSTFASYQKQGHQ